MGASCAQRAPRPYTVPGHSVGGEHADEASGSVVGRHHQPGRRPDHHTAWRPQRPRCSADLESSRDHKEILRAGFSRLKGGRGPAALRRSAALRPALERAVASELVLQDRSDEPASVLLERIAQSKSPNVRDVCRRRETADRPPCYYFIPRRWNEIACRPAEVLMKRG